MWQQDGRDRFDLAGFAQPEFALESDRKAYASRPWRSGSPFG